MVAFAIDVLILDDASLAIPSSLALHPWDDPFGLVLAPEPGSATQNCLQITDGFQEPKPLQKQPQPAAKSTPGRDPDFACKQCSKVFQRRTTLHRHQREVHQPPAFGCSICGDRLTHKVDRDRHKDEQHEEERSTVECMICGKHIRESALKDHVRSTKCQIATAERRSAESQEDAHKRFQLGQLTAWRPEMYIDPVQAVTWLLEKTVDQIPRPGGLDYLRVSNVQIIRLEGLPLERLAKHSAT